MQAATHCICLHVFTALADFAAIPCCHALHQIGFLDYVVRPLFCKLADLEPSLRYCLTRIDANRDAWEALVHSGAVAAA